MMAVMTFRSRRLVDYEKNYLRLKFLLQPFKKHRFYWRLVIIAKKIIFSVLVVLFSFNPSVQIATTFLAAFAFLILNIVVRPYKYASNTNLETTMLVSHVITLLFALIVNFSDDPSQFFWMSIIVVSVIGVTCLIAVLLILHSLLYALSIRKNIRLQTARSENLEKFDSLLRMPHGKRLFENWEQQLCEDDNSILHETISRYLRYSNHALSGRLRVASKLNIPSGNDMGIPISPLPGSKPFNSDSEMDINHSAADTSMPNANDLSSRSSDLNMNDVY